MPLFDSDAVLDARLTGPLDELISELDPEHEREFELVFGTTSQSLKVRVRGNSRLRVCDFPPLRLNFRASAVADTVFDGQDKLKLVTHCRNSDAGEQDLLEEFIAYRIFNLLTDVSFRVRLMRMHYVDTEGRLTAKAERRHAFVIETDDALAARIGGAAVTLPGVPKQRYDQQHAALVFVFQYLIGNTDWGLVKADYDDGCCHNIALIEVADVVYTVPYDFDLAGIVNARYAYPDPQLRIKRVTQRLYRGVCTDRPILIAAVERVLEQKQPIMDAAARVVALEPKSAQRLERFLSGFFERAADRDKLLRRFEADCVG